MLGKLIKYDFKAQIKMFIGMYIILFVTGLLVLVLDKLKDAYTGAYLIVLGSSLFKLLYVIAIVGIFIATWIMVLLRYRKNMLKDEGYLMHTLPVSAGQLHASKLIVSTIWYLVDCIMVMLSAVVATGNVKVFGQIKDFLIESGGEGVGTGFWLEMILFVVITVLVTNSQIFACLNLGYTSYGNKDLMSFVAYLVTYIISQIVSVIILMLYFLITTGSLLGNLALESRVEAVNCSLLGNLTLESRVEAANVTFVSGIFGASIVALIILIVGYNIVSVYVLNKKLNLE